MAPLEEIPVGDLHRTIDEIEGKQSTIRPTVAIVYENGVLQIGIGCDAPAWMPALVQRCLADTFGGAYPRPSRRC